MGDLGIEPCELGGGGVARLLVLGLGLDPRAGLSDGDRELVVRLDRPPELLQRARDIQPRVRAPGRSRELLELHQSLGVGLVVEELLRGGKARPSGP